MKNTHILWKPTSKQIANSNITQFIHFINHPSIKNYPQLYQWSIEQPEKFWACVCEFCDIKFSQKWKNILTHKNNMLETKWFTGATLNFAQNLLRYNDDKTAILFYDEQGFQQRLSYQTLHEQVAYYAQLLKEADISVGDRVAGFLPNLPETVIAMLATTSLGAIWSACSPDFGLDGVLERFEQIEPKVLFSVESYYYNGKRFDIRDKNKALKQKIKSITHTFIVPLKKNNANKPSLNFTQLPFNHPLYILYSSGTTGAPKCIVHGAGGTLIQHLKELVLHCNLTKKDTIFYFTTCGWMMWHWLVSSLAVGATIVLYDGAPMYPKADSLFNLIDQTNITVFGTSAKYLSAIEKAALSPMQSHKLKTLNSILSTGSPLLPQQFDFVYQHIKKDLRLSSISGGSDIISCFALGNPNLPVYRGELQCLGLGMKVEVYSEQGQSVRNQQGELVCTAPFPSMPIYFWNDASHKKYYQTYFSKYKNVWAHGDYAKITKHNGLIIYGRSDAVLNPGGIRIGTAEIYRQVEKFKEIAESLAVGQQWQGDIRIILFVKMQPGELFSETLKTEIKTAICNNESPHHVPAKIIAVPEMPKTINNKMVEIAVANIINNKPIKNLKALANPHSLKHFKNLPELQY